MFTAPANPPESVALIALSSKAKSLVIQRLARRPKLKLCSTSVPAGTDSVSASPPLSLCDPR
jgi:hypothetical protein